ncbi:MULTISPECIES: helix-turn-helix transcriptional regulator [unclassified Crossiella]|uniref:helix-turn-helix domain-containing protein n=1 Tax=unclassified Crossiella TaxID=2620835 RepID=UPI001FFE3BBC|nr:MULTISPECIES: helix-turn-helix transcriptional regulator [unclassified Crossiella]MCK2242118.1 helix-turn-helix transcriptional regulator [Crossiella sp. S99.2]MCK2256021.1 helix-turn-helix transcriptional regulator [Crossiella sp. S99.1]
MRTALVRRDISRVYQLLRRLGITQKRIAARTGQSQSEVSEITKGRQVMAYDVLARIGDGLGIPRGYMGMGYSPGVAAVGPSGGREDEDVQRRRFLAAAASAVVGATLDFGWGQLGPLRDVASPTPVPGRLGLEDVRRIEAATGALKALDYQQGGGSVRDAAIAHVSWCRRLLDADCTDAVRERLLSAVAGAHRFAGWTSFDVGLADAARYHYVQAVELAKQAGDHGLMCSVLYAAARIELHNGAVNDALKLFQLGEIPAADAADAHAGAVLAANQAWAYGKLNRPDLAGTAMARARRDFARAQEYGAPERPSWASFFTAADLAASEGMMHLEMRDGDPFRAIPLFEHSIGLRTELTARSQTFERIALATGYLRAGDHRLGVPAAVAAVASAEQLQSRRVLDRLTPLRLEAARRRDPDCQQLVHEITAVQSQYAA